MESFKTFFTCVFLVLILGVNSFREDEKIHKNPSWSDIKTFRQHAVHLLQHLSVPKTVDKIFKKVSLKREADFVGLAEEPELADYEEEVMPSRYEECLKVLNNFSYGVADFTWCAVDHARPVRVCESCVVYYSSLVHYYEAIFKVKDGDKYCNEVLLNADKLQVVPTLYSEIQDLWNQANCDACFNITTIDGEKHYELYDKVIKFNTYMDNVLDCIKNASNETMAPFLSLMSSHPNVSKVCNVCKTAYDTMNQFYTSLIQDTGFDSICMDVVDIVNSTRSLWSNHYKCLIDYNSTVALFTTMGCMCLLPIIFYVVMWCAAEEHAISIVPQKRLAWFQGSRKISVSSTSRSDQGPPIPR